MPRYKMTPDAFKPVTQASFSDLTVRERNDLQRLLTYPARSTRIPTFEPQCPSSGGKRVG